MIHDDVWLVEKLLGESSLREWNVMTKTEGNTALHYVVYNGNFHLCRLFQALNVEMIPNNAGQYAFDFIDMSKSIGSHLQQASLQFNPVNGKNASTNTESVNDDGGEDTRVRYPFCFAEKEQARKEYYQQRTEQLNKESIEHQKSKTENAIMKSRKKGCDIMDQYYRIQWRIL